MNSEELRTAEHELGYTPEQMAEALGISARSYYYRRSGGLPVKKAEALAINQMLAAHRMAAAKRHERKRSKT